MYKRDFGGYRTPRQANAGMAKVIIMMILAVCILISLARRIENSPTREKARAETAFQWQRKHPDEFAAMRRAARSHAYDTNMDTP